MFAIATPTSTDGTTHHCLSLVLVLIDGQAGRKLLLSHIWRVPVMWCMRWYCPCLQLKLPTVPQKSGIVPHLTTKRSVRIELRLDALCPAFRGRGRLEWQLTSSHADTQRTNKKGLLFELWEPERSRWGSDRLRWEPGVCKGARLISLVSSPHMPAAEPITTQYLTCPGAHTTQQYQRWMVLTACRRPQNEVLVRMKLKS